MKPNRNLIAISFLALAGYTAIGQQTLLEPVSKAFAIKNATIITAPGDTILNGTILLKDGLIESVETGTSIPPNYQILEADSMFVYSGFIAGVSQIGIPDPKNDNNQNDNRQDFSRGNPPNEAAGITPEVQLKDVLDIKDRSIADFREKGFTLAHSVPKGNMMPGKGAVILLGELESDYMLLRENVSLFSQFEESRRMYPATVIGILAKWRNLYRNAELAVEHHNNYRENPVGLKRPEYDQATLALMPLIESNLPVYFKAEELLELHRALNLAVELGFEIVPIELKQGWKLISFLKENQIPVMISLDLPEEEKEEKKDKESESDTASQPFADEKQKLKERINLTKKEYLSQAALFEEHEIPFGFSFLEVKTKDILPGIRRLIANGLSENAALAGLTTNPAEILGISSISGNIEKGKLANIIVSNMPIFEEDAQIRYVFVDGKKFEYELKKKSKKGSGTGTAVDVSGTWEYEIEVPGMPVEGKLTFKKNGDEFSVEVSNDQNPNESKTVDSLVLENNNVSFTVQVDYDGFDLNLIYDIDFEGDELEGSVTAGEFGTFPLTGNKISTPNQQKY